MKKTKILIVEDDKDTSYYLKDILLSSFPHIEIYQAHNNDDALDLLETITPDLITTDIIRPGGDGFDFFKEIQSFHTLRIRHVPIICISGQAHDTNNLAKLRQCGFQYIFAKPFDFLDLLSTIHELLPEESDPILTILYSGEETKRLDYKETIDLSKKDNIASLAKDIISMANIGGGTIIYGVSENSPGKFKFIGIQESLLPTFEISNLNRAIRDYLDPPIQISRRRIIDKNKTYILLNIPAAEESPVLAAKQNEKACLFTGRLYIRNNACESAEIKNSFEVRELLSRFIKSPNK